MKVETKCPVKRGRACKQYDSLTLFLQEMMLEREHFVTLTTEANKQKTF